MSIVLSVLAVIGTILKWILFVVLGIAALVLLIVILVLSCPVFYRLEGRKEGSDFGIRGKVTYFFSLIRLEADFSDGSLHYALKAAWKTLAESEKTSPERTSPEAEAFREHGDLEIEPLEKTQEEKPEDPDKAEILSGQQETDSPGEKNILPESETVSEEPARNEEKTLTEEEIRLPSNSEKPAEASNEVKTGSAPHVVPYEKKSMLQQGLDLIHMDPDEFLDGQKRKKEEKERLRRESLQLRAEEKRKRGEEQARRKEEKKAERLLKQKKSKSEITDEAKKPKRSLTEILDSWVDRFFDGVGKALDLLEAVLDAPDRIEETLDEKLGPKKKKLEKYRRLYDAYPRKDKTWKALRHLVWLVLKPLIPKKYDLSLRFGTGDPASTAQLLGLYDAAAGVFIRPGRHRKLDISADMEDSVLDADGFVKGHFSINTVLVFPVLWALFNRDILRLLRLLLKLKKKKKQREQNESSNIDEQEAKE